MNKKPFFGLLVLPFLLLTGCVGSKKDDSTPGARGEDVLSEEQVREMFTQKNEAKTVKMEKLDSLSINTTDETYELASGDDQIAIFRDEVSEIKAHKLYFLRSGAKLVENMGESDVLTNPNNWNEYGIDFMDLYHTSTVSGEAVYHRFIVDGYGHKLLDLVVSDLKADVTGFSTYQKARWDSTLKQYLYDKGVTITFWTKNDKNVVTNRTASWLYSDDFRTVKEDDPSDGAVVLNKAPVVTFTKDEVKYDVTLLAGNFAGNNQELYLRVKGGEGEKAIDKEFTVNTGMAGTFVGSHFIYQVDKSINQFAEDYTHLAVNKHVLLTYKVDLLTGEREEVNFQNYVTAFNKNWFTQADQTQPVEVPQYVVANMRLIEGKHITSENVRFVIDENWVLHDDLSEQAMLTRLGSGYYRTYSGMTVLYNADRNYVAVVDTMYRYAVQSYGPNFVIVRQNGKYGMINEKAEIVVPTNYTSYSSVDTIHYEFVNGSEHLYVDTSKMTNKVLVEAKDHELQLLGNGFATDKNNVAEATNPKDVVYFYGEVLQEFDHVAGGMFLISAFEQNNLPYGGWQQKGAMVQYNYTKDAKAMVDATAYMITIR